MDQEKIGKFIAECRKNKKLTQSELAEKLGVTDRSIGNWENGRNMPDLSLFKPLCDELGITINELINGEMIQEEEYKEIADKDTKVIFGGRLGQYKYYDMDKVILEALNLVKIEIVNC